MNAEFTFDQGPIDPTCACYTCKNFSRWDKTLVLPTIHWFSKVLAGVFEKLARNWPCLCRLLSPRTNLDRFLQGLMPHACMTHTLVDTIFLVLQLFRIHPFPQVDISDKFDQVRTYVTVCIQFLHEASAARQSAAGSAVGNHTQHALHSDTDAGYKRGDCCEPTAWIRRWVVRQAPIRQQETGLMTVWRTFLMQDKPLELHKACSFVQWGVCRLRRCVACESHAKKLLTSPSLTWCLHSINQSQIWNIYKQCSPTAGPNI